MGGGVADAVDAVDGGDHFDQFCQVHLVAVVGVATIGVYVLPQQVHFAHALGSQVGHLGNHVVYRAADFFATGVGHYAEGAVFAAAFHDRNERRRAVGTRFRQVVELLDFREADVDHAYAVTFHSNFADHIRQAVQGLGAEDHVYVRCPVEDGLAFLAGNAAANADNHVGLFAFETFPAAELVEHFFLGFFANGAGVQQQDVGVIRVVGHFNRFAGFEQVCHAGRVVLVHLAAVGFDEQLLGHGSHVVWCVGAGVVWGAGKNGLHIITGCLNINHRCLGIPHLALCYYSPLMCMKAFGVGFPKTATSTSMCASLRPSMAFEIFGKPTPKPFPDTCTGFYKLDCWFVGAGKIIASQYTYDSRTPRPNHASPQHPPTRPTGADGSGA